MNLKHELQSIISGIGDHSAEDIIKAAAHHIRESQKTSGDTKKSEFSKKQEAKKLTEWIDSQNLWFCEHDENRFISTSNFFKLKPVSFPQGGFWSIWIGCSFLISTEMSILVWQVKG